MSACFASFARSALNPPLGRDGVHVNLVKAHPGLNALQSAWHLADENAASIESLRQTATRCSISPGGHGAQ